MRFFQLTPKTRLVVLDPSEREEAVLEVARQQGDVLQVLCGLALGVQHALYSLDDCVAMGQEELQKLDVRLKRHMARPRAVGLSSPITMLPREAEAR